MLQRGHFYCTRPDTFSYKTQNGLNMGNLIKPFIINYSFIIKTATKNEMWDVVII